jgi:DHA1 family chloramphenicol resistance protein-like MFS transporter
VPVVVYVLGLSIFGLGTTEFMVAGLLPLIAEDYRVSVPAVGWLISAFAIGMTVGAPLLTAASLRLPRKTTLVGALVLFTAGQVLGALAPTYTTLLVARVITALATGAFWGVAAVTAVAAVSAERTARALAILLGGLTIANVLGVPAGTWLGQWLGWRSTFWAVAVVAVVSLVGVLVLVPAGERNTAPRRLTTELRTFRSGRVWLSLATITLYSAAIFGLFSYASPLITDVGGLPESAVSGLLLLFGVGAFVGNVIGGRFADRGTLTNLHVSFLATAAVMALLAVTAGWAIALVVLLFGIGVAGYSAAAALNARVFQLAESAPTLAGAVNTSAFNVGNTIGPWIGGAAISAHWGYRSPSWIGAVLLLAAFGLTLISRGWDARIAAAPAVIAEAAPVAR